MKPNEFKAFIEGMDVQSAPTPEQWARIREKIEALIPPPAPVHYGPRGPDLPLVSLGIPRAGVTDTGYCPDPGHVTTCGAETLTGRAIRTTSARAERYAGALK